MATVQDVVTAPVAVAVQAAMQAQAGLEPILLLGKQRVELALVAVVVAAGVIHALVVLPVAALVVVWVYLVRAVMELVALEQLY